MARFSGHESQKSKKRGMVARFSCTLPRQTYLPRRGLFSWSSFSMSPVSTVEDFEVEHKGSDSKLGKVEAEESYED